MSEKLLNGDFMIDVKLTEEFGMVQYCIEFISANQRDFGEDGEKKH